MKEIDQLVQMAAQKLMAIAEETAHSPEGKALEQLLQRLSRLDPKLAEELIAAFTSFVVLHGKLVAPAFYKEGLKEGITRVRQPRDHHRPGHSHRLQ